MTTERVATETQGTDAPETRAQEEPPQQLDTRDLQAAQDVGGGMTVEVERRDKADPAAERPAIKAAPAAAAPAPAAPATAAPLFDETAGAKLRERWLGVQTEFVDEPRAAVEKADSLVAEVLKQLTDTFAGERQRLENAWSHGDDTSEVSTEDLRQAIRRYRSFFDRLLSL